MPRCNRSLSLLKLIPCHELTLPLEFRVPPPIHIVTTWSLPAYPYFRAHPPVDIKQPWLHMYTTPSMRPTKQLHQAHPRLKFSLFDGSCECNYIVRICSHHELSLHNFRIFLIYSELLLYYIKVNTVKTDSSCHLMDL